MSFKAKISLPSSVRRYQGGYGAQAIPWILAAVTAASVAATVVETRNAGIATANNAAMQSRVEGDAAKQQEIQRRQQLMRALATQNAAAGAEGIETDGSVAAGARRQINQNENDLLVTDANASVRQSMLASQASNARAAGNLGAVASLLGGATKTYNAVPSTAKS